MKNDMPKSKPVKIICKEIPYKGCKINYTISNYGTGSLGTANINYNSGVALNCSLKKLENTPKEAESKIIEISKKWIDKNLG